MAIAQKEIVGIIAEYNPFHNGHKAQLDEIRRRFDAATVVCMSGSFTQRGEPAILDKWQRAAIATENGADLVVELPFVFAVRSAQDFAAGGVRLLHSIGAQKIAFGAECADIDILQKTAELIDLADTQKKMREQIRAGKSYAVSLEKTLTDENGDAAKILRGPNNILAIEYIRAIKKYAEGIEPLALERTAAAHDDDALGDGFASSTAIRRAANEKNPAWNKIAKTVPPGTLAALKTRREYGLPDAKFLLRPLAAILKTTAADELKKIFGLNEGLENKFLAAKNFSSLDGFIGGISSKRYPKSRIRRAVPHILARFCGAAAKIFDETGPLYVRPLAFNDTGRRILRALDDGDSLPVITRAGKFLTRRDVRDRKMPTPAKDMFGFDVRATDLRAMCFDEIERFGEDFLRSPICGFSKNSR